MPDKAWKAGERITAALLGGRRLANNGQRQADIDHPVFHIESKQRKAVPEWFRLAWDGALEHCPPDKIPLLVFVHAPGQGRKVKRYAILSLDDERVQATLQACQPE